MTHHPTLALAEQTRGRPDSPAVAALAIVRAALSPEKEPQRP